MMNDNPGIVITYPFPLGYHNGGARSVREIAMQMGKRKKKVYLLPVSTAFHNFFPRSGAKPEQLGFEFDGKLAKANVEVLRVSPHPVHPYLDGLQIRRRLKQLLAEKSVAAVLSYYHEAIFLPSFLRERSIPFAIHAIWQSYEKALRLPSKIRKPVQYLFDYLKHRMIINTYRRADRLFAISEHTAKELVKVIGVDEERIQTSYLGVGPEFAQVPRPKPDRIRQFLFFGRIVESKGVADAIQALKRLKAKGYNDWEFHMNGEGYPEWAQSLIEDAGLTQQIFIHEPTNDRDLFQFLSDGHLVLMPSHVEAFGLAFAEGQAAGLPVIAYAAGSVPEVVAHGKTGWLAPAGNIDQLTAYLIEAIENPEQTYRMGLTGRERVKERFSWQKTAGTILEGLQPFISGYTK